jgi:hypothetical protein
MSLQVTRSQPSWRKSDGRVIRLELWLVALGVVSALLIEVSQSARVAEISMELDKTRSTLQQAQARLEFVRAELDRRSTRAELSPLASRMGLAPPGPGQVVILPAEYLASPAARHAPADPPLLSLAEKASRIFVQEATARSRSED